MNHTLNRVDNRLALPEAVRGLGRGLGKTWIPSPPLRRAIAAPRPQFLSQIERGTFEPSGSPSPILEKAVP